MKIYVLMSTLLVVLWVSSLFAGDFSDNGDGTVTDNDTNLMWIQKKADTTMTWKDALAYCENLTFAGHSDWRLPNIKELISIVDYNAYVPAIDTTFFPDMESSYYWTSTTYTFNTDEAWILNFYNGYDFYTSKSFALYVIAVRDGYELNIGLLECSGLSLSVTYIDERDMYTIP